MSNKEQGNAAFKAKDFEKAIEHYTNAINEPAVVDVHALMGNRAAAYQNIQKFDEALADADKCIEVKPDWSKGYQRRGQALHSLGQLDEAIKAFEKGCDIDPANAQCEQALSQCVGDKMRMQNPGMGPGGATRLDMSGMGGRGPTGPAGGDSNPMSAANLQRMKTLPKFASFFMDPNFANGYEMVIQNPQTLIQMMQTDPRYNAIFQELTGIDMGKMQEEQMRNKDKQEAADKMRAAKMEADQKAREAEAKAKAEEALSPEEKAKIQAKKDAEDKKLQGNAAYKARNFEVAIGFYSEAIALNDMELTYYTNLAAVYFEMKEYEKCIAECEIAVSKSKGDNYDGHKMCKALGRKANALAQQQKYEESIATFKDALMEYNDNNVRANMNSTVKAKNKYDAQQYINPEKAVEHKNAGNEKYKAGDFPGAIKEFEEGIKRDPMNKDIYSNRCMTFIKLMEPVQALKDAEKCLELDPKFVKGLAKKGACHHLLKEYHKAMRAYEQGLEIDPNHKECQEGKAKTLYAINSQASSTGTDGDEDRQRKAMADPEIQGIMRNPVIQQVLKDMQENPVAGQQALKDPTIMKQINTLIEAGVLKVA